MCHPTCGSCDSGQNKFNECKTCFQTRYLFSNSCMCPKGQDEQSDYKCEDFDDSVNNLKDFIYALQWGFLALMLLSLFVKRNIPLTRKLIDVSQTLGLLFYFHKYYEPRPSIVFQLFQMTNLSSLIPNYIANHFYGEKMDQLSSSSFTYLNMVAEDQIPPYKFLINGKSSNFLINQLQVFVIWIVGLIIFFFVGGAISIIKQGKGFCEYIRFNLLNYVNIIFYFTFQESFLNVFLQLNNLKWTQGIHYASLIAMAIYLVLSLVIVRSILISQNQYPPNVIDRKLEMFRRRDCYHFLFAFEDPLTDLTLKEKSEKTHLSPSEIITSNWVVLSLIQKAIITAAIVFQYDEKVEISMIVIIIIFFKLFFLVRPLKNKLILIFCFLADVYLVVVIILTDKEYLAYLLWPGILCLNAFMIVEDIFSHKCYPEVQEFNYMEKVMNLNQNQQKQESLAYDEKNARDIILQNPNNKINVGQTPQNSQKPLNAYNAQKSADLSNQLPLNNNNNNNNNTTYADQSLFNNNNNNKDTSMFQQNLIQNEQLQQDKLDTIEDNQGQHSINNHPANNSVKQSNQNLPAEDKSLQVLKNNQNIQKNPVTIQTKQGMIEMKSKYLEKMKQQSGQQLQKQPSNPQVKPQQNFQNPQIKKRMSNDFDPQHPYGKQNNEDEYSLNKQSSIDQKLKKESLIRGYNDSENQPQKSQKQLNQTQDKAMSDVGNKNNKKIQKERDSFLDSDEEFEEQYLQQNPPAQKAPIESQSQYNNKIGLQQQNQRKPDVQKTVKQQKIEDELSGHWNLE